jgi:sulfite reductase (NADPH) flavoprotein alpha-component
VNAVVAPEFLPAPLNADKSALLARLVEGLQPAELYWVAAWVAAQAQSQGGAAAAVPVPAKAIGERLTIVYGSQTGNAKRIAEQLAERSEAAGLPVRLVRANAYPQRELAQERYLAVVISTQGEGEPPDDARGFVEFVVGKRAPKLPSLQFVVLGLGDSSYPQFCVIGRQLDARLAELGGTRFAPFGETDVDVEAVAKPWLDKTLEQAREVLKSIAPAARVTPLHAVTNRSTYSRERPFAATVLANQRIVARDNERDVRHVELSLEGSGLQYAPGDALGIWPSNPAALVEQWLATLQLDGALDVTHEGRTLTLTRWLAREREITRLSRSFIAALAATSGHAELVRALQPEHAADFTALLASDQPIDLLRRHPAAWQPDALVAALRPLTPRLYSIASSPKLVGDEVHLTVAVVDYEAHGSLHWGAASAFLATADEDGKLPVFIESNERFRLPADNTRDIIMIGPGTGVAPFRAFVQERHESGASGRNWLFFGNRHFAQDFLYQTEWQEALKHGALHRLELAFSRDQSHKTYVQDRLREQGAELYAWLQNGAHLYVCGDSAHMAKDVHAALVDVITTHGKQSPDDAKAWLNELLQQGRYARDVY